MSVAEDDHGVGKDSCHNYSYHNQHNNQNSEELNDENNYQADENNHNYGDDMDTANCAAQHSDPSGVDNSTNGYNTFESSTDNPISINNNVNGATGIHVDREQESPVSQRSPAQNSQLSQRHSVKGDIEDDDIPSSSSEESNPQSGYESAESNRLSGYGSTESISREERLLEEMLRLKLNTNTNSVLPPKRRIKLFPHQFEHFEEILKEPELWEKSLMTVMSPAACDSHDDETADPSNGPAMLDFDVLEDADSPLNPTNLELDSLSLQDAITAITDYESSDLIFLDNPELDSSSDGDARNSPSGQQDNQEGDNQAAAPALKKQTSRCECDSCVQRTALVAEMAEETKKLQECWAQLRKDFQTVYSMVMEDAWNDSNRPRPDLNIMKDRVHRLVWKDPHQLFHRLESIVRNCVMEVKTKLKDLLQRESKSPNLAQVFIHDLLAGHDRLCDAGKILAPVLSDLEVNHLRRFSLTWELLTKHLYQVNVYTDPVIQNNLPIFLSQLRVLYPTTEERYTELVRGYLDFDVEMENVGVFWSGTEALLMEYTTEQQKMRERKRMLREDWEKFKQHRKQQQAAENNGDTVGTAAPQRPTDFEQKESDDSTNDNNGDNEEAVRACECNHCTAPLTQDGVSPSLLTGGHPSSAAAVSSSAVPPLCHHLYNLPPSVSHHQAPHLPVLPVAHSTASSTFAMGSLANALDSTASSSDPASAFSMGALRSPCEPGAAPYPASGSVPYVTVASIPYAATGNSNVMSASVPNVLGGGSTSFAVTTTVNHIGVGGTAAAKLTPVTAAQGTAPVVSTTVRVPPSQTNSVVPQDQLHSSSQASQTQARPNASANLKPVPAATPVADLLPRNKSLPPSGTAGSSAQGPTTGQQVPASGKQEAGNSNVAKPRNACHHKHNNANAKELKKLMGNHECGKSKSGQPRKSKSTSAIGNAKDGGAGGTDEGSEDSSPEDSCASSTSGQDKSCACCYCEVFGHGGPTVAPVSRNYPEMRGRLRLLLSKKKKNQSEQQQQTQQQMAKKGAAAVGQQQPQQQQKQQQHQNQQPVKQVAPQPQPAKPSQPVAVTKPPPVTSDNKPIVRESTPGAARTTQGQPISGGAVPPPVTNKNTADCPPSRQPSTAEIIAQKDVGEILEYIEGNKNILNEKKRMKKERQKQIKLEELKKKQEEDRKGRELEEAERKKREEEERRRKEEEDKAAKKAKKKAAQKAKKIAAQGQSVSESEPSPASSRSGDPNSTKSSNMIDLEALRLKHIQEQKELLEKQEQQLGGEQRRLELQLQGKLSLDSNGSRSQPVNNQSSTSASLTGPGGKPLSKKQAKKLAKAQQQQQQQQQRTGVPSSISATPVAPTAACPSSQYLGAGPVSAPCSGLQPGSAFPCQMSCQGNCGSGCAAPLGGGSRPIAMMPPFQHSGMGGSSAFTPVMGGARPGPAYPAGGGGLMYSAGGSGGPRPMMSGNSPFQPSSSHSSTSGGTLADNNLKSDQPMVTIRRVMRPEFNEPTVTISVKKDEKNEKEKVLFALINGQVHKTGHAPDDLIPGAKPLSRDMALQLLPEDMQEGALSKKQKKKLKKTGQGANVQSAAMNGSSRVAASNAIPPSVSRFEVSSESNFVPAMPIQVPFTPQGNVDLEKLSLPQGISISKISGPMPERKYFPCKSESELQNERQAQISLDDGSRARTGDWPPSHHQYHRPTGKDSNVIVVDTNQLPTREEEEEARRREEEANSKGKKKLSMANSRSVAAPVRNGSEPAKRDWDPSQYGGYIPPAGSAANGGGQVLIKSVNGKVVITPVPGTGSHNGAVASAANQPANGVSAGKPGHHGVNGQDMNGIESAPQLPPVEENPRRKNKKKRKNTEERLDEINSIFEPNEEIDLNNGDLDPADKEIEEFKRFCFQSIPAQNRAKVSINVNEIFKKKN